MSGSGSIIVVAWDSSSAGPEGIAIVVLLHIVVLAPIAAGIASVVHAKVVSLGSNFIGKP